MPPAISTSSETQPMPEINGSSHSSKNTLGRFGRHSARLWGDDIRCFIHCSLSSFKRRSSFPSQDKTFGRRSALAGERSTPNPHGGKFAIIAGDAQGAQYRAGSVARRQRADQSAAPKRRVL